MKLPWDKFVGLRTDGAPVLCGEKSGLVSRMRVKMQEENCTDCVFLQKGDADSSDFPVSTLLGDLLNTSELGRVCHGIPCTWFPHRTKHHLPFNSWERLERTEKMGGLF